MAGKIIADTIEASGSQISLNVGNLTILTASSTGLTLIPTTNVNVNLTNSIVTLTNGSATSPGLTFSGNTRTGLFMPSANTLAFTAANTESMRIDSSGNVGIGTNSPGAKLDVRGSSTFLINSSNPTAWVSSDSGLTTQSMYMQVNTTSSDTRLGSYTNHPLLFMTNNNERMRITTDGNVGIGGTPVTMSNNNGIQVGPSAILQGIVNNQAIVSCNAYYGGSWKAVRAQTGYAAIRLNAVAAGAISFHGNSSAFAADGALSAMDSTDEKMRIDSSGNFLVNTTSATGTSKFVVAADTTTTNPMSVVNTRSTTATDYSILFYRNGSLVGSVQTTLAGVTSYVTSSDYRLKQNILPMTGALTKVMQLKPVTYKWKSDNSDGQGFIAHELQEVVPEAVCGEKDEIDADGNPKHQGVDTSFLVATLTAAIQELKAIVDAQAVEIAALKAK